MNLFISCFSYTPVYGAIPIDGSWQHAISTIRNTPGLSLGNEVMSTYGPLSTKLITTINPLDGKFDFVVSNLILMALVIVCSACVLSSLKNASPSFKYTILVVLIASLFTLVSIDILFTVTLLCILPFLKNITTRNWPLLFGPVILSTYKNNLLLLMCVALAFSIAIKASRKDYGAAVVGAILAPFVTVMALVMAGVWPERVISYLVLAVRNALSYGDYMAINGNEPWVVLFFWSLVCYGVYRVVLLFKSPSLEELATSLFIGVVLFAAYKGATVRSDGHLLQFFPALVFMLNDFISRITKATRVWLAVGAVSLILAFSGSAIVWSSSYRSTAKELAIMGLKNTSVVSLVNRFNYFYFRNIRAESASQTLLLAEKTTQIRQSLERSGIDLGSASITAYANVTYYLPYLGIRDINYSPFFQNYQAFPTDLFDDMYLEYLQENPHDLIYVDTKYSSIDGRAPFLDLPETYNELSTNYKVLIKDDNAGIAILKRASEDSAKDSCGRITGSGATQEELYISSTDDRVSIDVSKGLFGELKSFVYKNNVYVLSLNDGEKDRNFRIARHQLSEGFSLKPFIVDHLSKDSTTPVSLAVLDQRTGERVPINYVFSDCD